jgi:hypothetical protein
VEEPKRPWVAAASSVPKLRREPDIAPAREVREARDARDEIEPTRESEVDREFFGAPAERAALPEFPGDTKPVPPPVRLAPLRESWWTIALEELRTDRRIHVGAAVLLAAFAVYQFWPRREPTVSISYLAGHPHEADGRAVTIRGRVGDVFPVGGGYAFYLRQGHDTIVVFTRTRTPMPNENITVRGKISTGFLDGAPHQSLFEDGP